MNPNPIAAPTHPSLFAVDELDRILRQDSPRVGMWLDTSDLTPEETVREIERRAWTEAIIRT
ncbi:hypothetical protein [Paenibacillus thiaminolyticus]|uniref:hypothetical protein n=1 Tax=Paenibacillus thiaminolyticus TaxID=49283 RepID=UPI00254321A0|nr:hypothetical protein [Paenibacillus thiaminolyticus]WII36501.1 hypothetical protein O0V01_23005 [Paenibacillus thiaminolyticus]